MADDGELCPVSGAAVDLRSAMPWLVCGGHWNRSNTRVALRGVPAVCGLVQPKGTAFHKWRGHAFRAASSKARA